MLFLPSHFVVIWLLKAITISLQFGDMTTSVRSGMSICCDLSKIKAQTYWYVATKTTTYSAQQGPGIMQGWQKKSLSCQEVVRKTTRRVSSKPFSISFLDKDSAKPTKRFHPWWWWWWWWWCISVQGSAEYVAALSTSKISFLPPILAQVSLSLQLCRLCLFQKTIRGGFYGPKQPSKDQTFFLVGVCAYHSTSQTLVKWPTVSC